MSVRVGVIGVGRMGLPICGRLVRAGCVLTASDRAPDREAAVRAAGGRWVSDTAALVDQADVLVTVLPGPADVQEVMAVATSRLRPGMAWIDMSSNDPRVGRALAARAAARGTDTLDATLGGGVAAAQTGTLQLFVGGDFAVVERHRPLLEAIGRVEHVGASGAGQLVKLIVNLLWFGQSVAVGEALLVARRAGLDVDLIAEVLGRSAAGSEFIRGDLPDLLGGGYRASFGLDRCCAQIDAAVEIAGELDIPFELSAAVQDAYRAALARYGPVDGELLAVALREERAGVELRSPGAAGADTVPAGPVAQSVRAADS